MIITPIRFTGKSLKLQNLEYANPVVLSILSKVNIVLIANAELWKIEKDRP